MKSINFNEGYKEYKINEDDSRIIRIRITDVNLLERADRAMSEIDRIKTKYIEQNNGKITEEQLIEFDREIRELINTAFDSDICTPAIGAANVATPVGDGNLLITAFLSAFRPMLEEDIKAAAMTMKIKQPEVRPEVQKYTEKVPTIAPVTAKPVAGLSNPYGTPLPDISGLSSEQKKALLVQLIS